MTVRWGLLSTAAIGRVVVDATRDDVDVDVVAVASRDRDRARAYADDVGVPDAYGSYEALLAADDVDAVYVPLPIALHTAWTVAALEAGKHVLCEKPFATSPEDAGRCFDAADAAGRLVVEGLMYRRHPQTDVVRRLLAEGAIGDLAFVRAALSVSVSPGDIRRSSRLGGGALLDLGCYCTSAIRLVAGEPERVYAQRVPDGAGDGTVDLRLSASLELPGGVLAQFDVGLDLPRRDEWELVGTDGVIVVDDPWLCTTGSVELRTDDGVEQVPVDPDGRYGLTGGEADAYRLEFEAVSRMIAGDADDGFGRDDAVAQARLLQRLERSSRERAPA